MPHNLESLDLQTNVDIVKNITAEVKAGLDGLKIYPVIGNHDTYPQDVISMPVNEAIIDWGPAWFDLMPD